MTKLYFIAFVLPEPLNSRIQLLKKKLKEKYDVSHALNSPPHITLIPPFTAKDEEIIRNQLKSIPLSFLPFTIKVDGYRSFGFRKRPILYLKLISPTLKVWRSFHYSIITKWGGRHNRPFIPHITLAHRDLTPETHQKIIEEIEPFSGKGKIEEVSLLRHNRHERIWEVIDRN